MKPTKLWLPDGKQGGKVPGLNDKLVEAVKQAGAKPEDTATQAFKKNWNQTLSDRLAHALAEELRERGMEGTLPNEFGVNGRSGAERRLSGGIGAKKVDVSWATEESGLILACSVKTIMFRDGASRNFQKNLTNRRGDLLVETTTLHRRFPYAVLTGFLFLDAGAESDGTGRRRSTFDNAFPRLRLFTGRPDPQGREEMFERLFLLLVDSNPFKPVVRAYEVSNGEIEIDLDIAMDEICELVGERNFDLYDGTGGRVVKS